jgi:hypothetical protein
VTPKPLTPEQHQAAALLGAGYDQGQAAAEVSTTTTSIRRWLKRDDFAALVKEAREKALDENPTARSVCEQALSATTTNGRPAWKIRLDAAKLLMQESGAVPADAAPRAERIFMDPED